MPSWTEFRLAVQGLLRLARFNSEFLRFFDRSRQGALRSFWLALPIYPYYLVQIWPSDTEGGGPDVANLAIAMSVGYLYLWLVVPLIISWVAPLIGRAGEMPGCITAYNWMSLLSVGVSLPLMILGFVGVPVESLQVPYDIALMASLIWEAFLFMRALRIPLWQAGLATLADYFLLQRLVLPMFYLLGSGN